MMHTDALSTHTATIGCHLIAIGNKDTSVKVSDYIAFTQTSFSQRVILCTARKCDFCCFICRLCYKLL